VIGSARHRRPGWVRSYLADGRLVQWRPPGTDCGRSVADGTETLRWAVDAEIAAQPVPPTLAARTGVVEPAEFWPRWTAVEVAAKLLDVPVIMWLAEHGLCADAAADDGVVLRTAYRADLVITAGRR
jgi:hypothetical protein